MRTFGIIVLCVVLVIGGGVAWCKLAYPTYTYRYRMTVEVMVDGAIRSGSSVIEVQIHTQPNLLANPTIVPKVRGEAVLVDLLACGVSVTDRPSAPSFRPLRRCTRRPRPRRYCAHAA